MDETLKRNIELKARYSDLQIARDVCHQISAQFEGVLQQEDVYFNVPQSRLKLRTINNERSELIAYDRPDETAVRGSDYRIIPIADRDAAVSLLQSVLGVRGIVRKVRELYLWHTVRIHLDTVESLGTFIEFEAIVSGSVNEEICRCRVHELAERMRIAREDHIAGSYIDF